MTREQFIALVSEEQESLRRFLLALCEGDRMEAEDIAQEAMVKAYIAMERFVEKGLIHSLGLSCFYIDELKRFLPQVSIKPVLVQNEIHPVGLLKAQ